MPMPLRNAMNTPISTPGSGQINAMSTRTSYNETLSELYQSGPAIHQRFKPFPGSILDPVDIRVDNFFNSPDFEMMCAQAIQLAGVLPLTPPPTEFISFDGTPMHQWYQTILIEFVETFMRRLRTNNQFPMVYRHRLLNGVPIDEFLDNVEAFNHEATAHINSILRSFNSNFAAQEQANNLGLMINYSQPHAMIAAQALQETIAPANYAPKRYWRVGEVLHAEYRRRLRMFESGIMRLMADREESKWILDYPIKLRRGVDAYKEYYIACLREEIISFRIRRNPGLIAQARGIGNVGDADDVFN